ncbi:MAG: leucine-rich repeat domain-containing protein [Clostridia bacterium]|nr:leucine-rich repeat domain-containing protein [Clostridia bacterium]
MKRKVLLIVLMIAIFVLVFMLGTSAGAYDENRTTIDYNGQSVQVITSTKTASEVASILGNNATMQALFKDDNALVVLADANGNLFAFPTWYIIEPKDTNPSYVAISEVEYAFVNTLVNGSTFAKGAIRYIEFPHGMTEVRANSVFGGSDGMYEVNVTEVHIPNTVSSIGGAFENKTRTSQLKYVYIEAGNSISKIPGGAFSSCTNLEYIQFENLTEITSLDGISNCNFTGEVDLSKCTKLVSISGNAFSNCSNLTKITLPDSLQTIGNNCFWNCPNAYLASEYLPTSLKTIGTQFFYNSKNFNNLLIFPEGFESLGNEAFQDMTVKGGASGNEFNLVFLGEMHSVVYLNGNGHQKHAEKVTVYFAKNSLSDYNKDGFYIKPSGSSVTSVPGAIRVAFCEGVGAGTNGNVTGVEYIYITNVNGSVFTSDYVNHETYGFDFDNHTHYGSADIIPATCGENGFKGTNCIVCDKQIGEVLEATGDHKYEDDHDCTTAEICTVCTQTVVEANSSHRTAVTITYENGYLGVGVRTESCENDGCEYCQVTNPRALFEFLGYSKDMASTQICVGYYIAYAEIEEYKSANNLTVFEYGLVAGVSQNIPNAKPLQIVDGEVQAITPTKGSIASIDLSTHDLTLIDFRLTGFEDYQDLEILMCAYVYDGTSLVYLQDTQAQSVSAKTIAAIEMK